MGPKREEHGPGGHRCGVAWYEVPGFLSLQDSSCRRSHQPGRRLKVDLITKANCMTLNVDAGTIELSRP
jgi:hypothetical protein